MTGVKIREQIYEGSKSMRKRFIVLCAVLSVSLLGIGACGAVEDQVQDRANEELPRQKQNAEDRIRQEATRALEGQ